jgi:hypothetical protein
MASSGEDIFMKNLLEKEAFTFDDVKDLKILDMKNVLRHHKLPLKGNKEDLQNRMINEIPNDDNTDVENVTPAKKQRKEHPVDMILLNKEEYFDDDIKDLHVDQLKKILKKHGRQVTGKKNELMERILSIGTEDDASTVDMDVENDKLPGDVEDDSGDILERDEYDKEFLLKLSTKQLKAILIGRGLKNTGIKSELIERIIELIPMPEYEPPTTGITYDDDPTHSITFSVKQAEKSGTTCRRCNEEIDQGRL